MKVFVNASENNQKTILTLLEEMGYVLPCNCQGRHLCNSEQYSFDCAMIPTSPVEVSLPSTVTTSSAAASSDTAPASHRIQSVALEELTPSEGIGDTLLVDLGTTTIALALIHAESGSLRRSATFANPQIRYGTDVIARIQAAISGEKEVLKTSVCTALQEQTSLLCEKNHQTTEEIRRCYIGGNTTMIHLLLGYDCTPLSHSPFSIRDAVPAPFSVSGCLIAIAPWISAFVGGDICAGLYACGIQDARETSLFVDLGTNGEMVLAHEGTLYTAATAAGPALEGSGLSCGCPGIPGAIRHVRLRRLFPALETIGNLHPVGICGSGAVSLCSELLRHGYLTGSGVLTDRFPAEGLLLSSRTDGTPIRFTADDLRNVQLALAAIAAGIDTLAQEADIPASAIRHVYLGGGFGFYLSMEDCATLGLFSDIPTDRITAMGNTCLRGLYQWAVSADEVTVPSFCVPLNLAESDYFQKQFVKHMTYPEQNIT